MSQWLWAVPIGSILLVGCATNRDIPLTEDAATSRTELDPVLPVSLSFEGQFGGKPFSCNEQFTEVGASDAAVTVSDYKLYVSRVRMLTEDGAEVAVTLTPDGLWQQEDVALLDFEDGTGNCSNGTAPTNDKVLGTVPAGEYTGVAFDIGVPFEKNHADPTLAASPLSLTSMFWNWRGGYRFMRVDMAQMGDMEKAHSAEAMGKMQDAQNEAMKESMQASKHAEAGSADSSGAAHGGGKNVEGAGQHGGGRGWSLHVGSAGCAADTPTSVPSSCASPNRIEISMTNFDAIADTLVIDPALVLTQVDVTSNTPETAPGCMSSPTDPECKPVFPLLGLEGTGTDQQLIKVR